MATNDADADADTDADAEVESLSRSALSVSSVFVESPEEATQQQTGEQPQPLPTGLDATEVQKLVSPIRKLNFMQDQINRLERPISPGGLIEAGEGDNQSVIVTEEQFL